MLFKNQRKLYRKRCSAFSINKSNWSFSLVSFFNWISPLMGNFMRKSSFKKNSCWWDWQLNVNAWPGFELPYLDIVVLIVNHFVTGTSWKFVSVTHTHTHTHTTHTHTYIYIYIYESYLTSRGLCLFVWVLWHINLSRLFNSNLIFLKINGSISNNSV